MSSNVTLFLYHKYFCSTIGYIKIRQFKILRTDAVFLSSIWHDNELLANSLKNELPLRGNWRSTLHISRWHIAMPDARSYIYTHSVIWPKSRTSTSEESACTVTDVGLICQMKRNGGRQSRDRRRDSRTMTRANDFATNVRVYYPHKTPK